MEKDSIEKIVIVFKFLGLIFPTVLGLMDFILDINYIFV